MRQASFQRIFDGTNHFGEGAHFEIRQSTMSSNGQVVAFYGRNVKSPCQDKLCVHDFETTAGPVEVNLDSHNLGSIFENSGLVSNADGTRIFFVADDTRDVVSGDYRFCRVNGTAGDVTVMQDAIPSNVEVPLDIATDATGEYLYFNETDNGDRGIYGAFRPQKEYHLNGSYRPTPCRIRLVA